MKYKFVYIAIALITLVGFGNNAFAVGEKIYIENIISPGNTTDVIGLLPSYSNVSGASVDVLITEK